MAALADEADMPLEQLLAMYGMVMDDSPAGKPGSSAGQPGSSDADGAAQEPSDGGPGSSSKRRRLAAGKAYQNTTPEQAPCIMRHISLL